MALTEPQILRYSRQILLKDVGGVGQERLLATEVHLAGGGRAVLTAAAYLAGGGSVISPEPRLATVEDAGFLLTADEAESGADVSAAAARMNPDAGPRATRQRVALVAAPAAPSTAPGVTLGAKEGHAAILVASAEACPDCLARNVLAAPPPGGALGVAAGTLAATLVQRLALGLEPHGALQLLWLSADGTLDRGPVQRCDRCR